MIRIKKISSYIDENEKVIDVGCDMALLSLELAKRGIYSIASDLRENIIKNAEKNMPQKYLKYIAFRVGNGITLYENENDYTLVLAGMGTHLILDIISSTIKKFNKIITISNNNHDILRKEMIKYGYKVSKEEIIKEKNKYYNLIVFIPGFYIYTKEEELIGINHQNKKLLKEKNEFIITKYTNILNNIPKEENKKSLKEKLDIIKQYK